MCVCVFLSLSGNKSLRKSPCFLVLPIRACRQLIPLPLDRLTMVMPPPGLFYSPPPFPLSRGSRSHFPVRPLRLLSSRSALRSLRAALVCRNAGCLELALADVYTQANVPNTGYSPLSSHSLRTLSCPASTLASLQLGFPAAAKVTLLKRRSHHATLLLSKHCC